MPNCKYDTNGFVPKDRTFVTALNTKNLAACSIKSNSIDSNTISIPDGEIVIGVPPDLTTITSTDITTTNITADNGVFDVITANTGNITTVNATDVNTTDLTVTQNTTSQTYTVNPAGFPEYNLATVSGAEQNILAYGGDNTGVADQKALVETFINTAGFGGKTLFFPAGTYRFNTGISLPQNTRLVGDGYGNTVFRFYDNTAGNTMITLSGNDNIVENIFMIYNGTATDSILFGGNDLQRVQLTSIQTQYGSDRPAFWLVATGIGSPIISNSYINVTDTGIQISDTVTAVVTENLFENSNIAGQVAIRTLGTAKVLASNNVFQNVSTNLFEIASSGSVFSSNIIENAVNVYTGAGANDTTIIGFYGTEFSNFQTGINVEGTRVVSTQQLAIADAAARGAAYVQTEANDTVDQLNLVISALRAHGLIAT